LGGYLVILFSQWHMRLMKKFGCTEVGIVRY
jgi:hypothetical protein